MANFTALKTAINNAIKTNGNEEITGAILQAILDAMVETLGDSAITDLENAITAEVTNRENAVGDVAAGLTAEAQARQALDYNVNNRINAEEYNRQNADASLSQTMSHGFQTLGSQMTALNAAISALNAAYQNGYLYGGIATPSSSPSNNKCFYIALQGGTYTNFGGVGVVEGINIINNDSGWKVEHIYDQTALLNEFYLLRQQVIQAITSFDPIVIEGDVTNAPDEEDLTSNANHLLQFKNNAYSPLEFSGLGKKYLRKNIAPLSESAPFNGFVEGVTAEETLSGTPTQIFWDRMNTRFVGFKDGVYYLDWTGSDNYVPVSTSLVYMYNGTPYRWTGSDFIVDETEVPNLVNCLTQDMINEANTIYIIRYDYTMKENITIPANSVLQFDGGSLSNASGNSYTLTGNNAIINSPYTDEYIVDIELLGTFDKNDRKSSVYIIETERFGITEGYFEKGQDGHYTSEQYTKMYNNGVGFTNAIKWAYANGYKGVSVKRGTYCFIPYTNENFPHQSMAPAIDIADFCNFDIDLNGSKFCYMVDSTERSQYYNGGSNVYDYWGTLIRIFCCENIKIHNGKICGDRELRSYIASGEANQEQTYGISMRYVFNIIIENIEVYNFMGDGITSRSYATSLNGVWERAKVNSIIPITVNGKADYGISDFVDCNSIPSNDDYTISKKIKNSRTFTIAGDFTHTLGLCYCPKIYVYTYSSNDVNASIIRALECGYFQEFQLIGEERYVKLLFLYETGLTVEGRNPCIAIYRKMSCGLVISNCNIHDSHRGNLSGFINDTEVKDCYFSKTYRNDSQTTVVPNFPGNTNYHIDVEESFCRGLKIHGCTFVCNSTNSGKLLIGCYDFNFYDNVCEYTAPFIYNALLVNIFNNRLGGFVSGIHNSYWLLSISENDVYGASYMRRTINFYHNKVNEAVILWGIVDKTIVNIHDNDITLSANNTSGNGLDNTDNKYNEIFICNNIIRSRTEKANSVFYLYGIVNNNILIRERRGNELGTANKLDIDKYISLQKNKIKGYDIVPYSTNSGIDPIIDGGESSINFDDAAGVLNGTTLTLLNGSDARQGEVYTTKWKNVILSKLPSCAFNNIINFNNDIILENVTIKNYAAPGKWFINVGDGYQVNMTFINCDFGNLPYLISGYTFIETPTRVNIVFKNCKAIKGFKFWQHDPNSACDTYGTTSERPMYIEIGFMFMDITLGKSIWWNGTAWVDATGATV